MIQKKIKNAIFYQQKELQLSELIIPDFENPEINSLLEKSAEIGVDTLVLKKCKITSLSNFPKLTKLFRLDLSFNNFQPKELEHLAKLQSLVSLSLQGNSLDSANDLIPLKKLKNLRQIELYDTSLASLQDLIDRVREILPQIALINSYEISRPNAKSFCEELGMRTFD